MADRTDDQAELVAVPDVGRRFATNRRVRWGDVDRSSRLRLDALARYLQDLANDDTRDAGHDPLAPWVVRRTVIVVHRRPRLGEQLDLVTFNGGTGSRWAERRTSVRGERGHVECASLWVFVDPISGRPARLTQAFHDTFDEAAQGRTVGARLTHGPVPGDGDRRAWAVRATDIDPLGHVNNAATWEAIEDELARRDLTAGRAELEYHDGIDPADDVELVSRLEGDTLAVWLTVQGRVRATARLNVG